MMRTPFRRPIPLLMGLLWLFFGAPAHAAGIGLQVQGLPAPPIMANGISVAYIPVLITDEIGEALLGEAAVEGSTDDGEVLDAWSAGPGIYLISYRPPPVLSPHEVTLAITARQGRRQGKGDVKVKLVPAGRGAVETQASPRPFTLGEDTQARLTFVARNVSGQPVDSTSLFVRASAGAIEDLLPTADGTFTATYIPPEGRQPQLVLITAVDAASPDDTYGFYVFPLNGKATFPVRAAPGVKLEFDVGEATFGPYITNADGVANVTLVVPPGVQSATVRSVDAEGVNQVEQLDLAPRASKQLAVVAPPTAIAANGTSRIPVRILVVDAHGRPRSEAPLKLSAERGSIADLHEEGGGLYQAYYIPPETDTAGEDLLTATLEGEGDLQEDTLPLLLSPASSISTIEARSSAPQARAIIDWLSLDVSREQIPDGAPTEVAVNVKGMSANGGAVPLLDEIQLVASRGSFSARRGEPDGSVSATLRLPALAVGSTVAVIAADPVQGLSTYSLVYAGDKPTRALADSAPEGALVDGEAASKEETAAEGDIAADAVAAGVVERVEPAEPPADQPLSGVRPPPPPALRTRGTRMTVSYTAGYYSSVQTSDGSSSVYNGFPFRAPTYLGGGLGIDHWGSSRFGISAEVTGTTLGFDSGGNLTQPGYVVTLKYVATADLRWRYLKTVSGHGLGFGFRLGGSAQNHPLFVEQPSGITFTHDRQLYLARAGIDAIWLARGITELRLGYDAGVALPRTPVQLTTHHGHLSIAYRVSTPVSLGLKGEAWLRDTPAVAEGETATTGQVTDRWLTASAFVGMHF